MKGSSKGLSKIVYALLFQVFVMIAVWQWFSYYTYNYSADHQRTLSLNETQNSTFNELEWNPEIGYPQQITKEIIEKSRIWDEVNMDDQDIHVEDVILFIAISSGYTESSKLKRQAIRETWLKYEHKWEKHMEYKFFMGTPSEDVALSAKVDPFRERDIVYGPYVDTYRNLSLKTLHMAKWTRRHFNFRILLKVDDDSFVRLDRVPDYIESILKSRGQTIDTASQFYWGPTGSYFTPDRTGKFALTYEEFPFSKGPPWVSGFFCGLSPDCVEAISEQLWPQVSLEDINTALILDRNKTLPTPLEEVVAQWSVQRCRSNAVVLHYVGRREIYGLYKASLYTFDNNMCREDYL